jgi:hypothetical protein
VNPYLAKLKTIAREKTPTSGTLKTFKTSTRVGSEGFEGDQGTPFSPGTLPDANYNLGSQDVGLPHSFSGEKGAPEVPSKPSKPSGDVTAKPCQPAAPGGESDPALQGLCIQCAGPGDRFGELHAYADPQFGLVWLHRECKGFWLRDRRTHPSIEHIFRCTGTGAVH